MFDTLYQSLTNLDLCSVGSHSSKVGGHRAGGGGGKHSKQGFFFVFMLESEISNYRRSTTMINGGKIFKKGVQNLKKVT